MRYLDTWSETEKCVLRDGKKNNYNILGVEPKMAEERPWYVPRGIRYFEIEEDWLKETVHLSMEHSSFIDDLVHPSEEDSFQHILPTVVFLRHNSGIEQYGWLTIRLTQRKPL